MSIGRCFKVFHKIAQDKMSPYSVIMESKFESALMFESGVVITLCKHYLFVYIVKSVSLSF